MSTSIENKTHYTAIAYTATFLGLLLALFLLVVFTTPSKSSQETILYVESEAGNKDFKADSKFTENDLKPSSSAPTLIAGSSVITDKTETTAINSSSDSKNEFINEVHQNLDPNLKAILDKANTKQSNNRIGTATISNEQGSDGSKKETGVATNKGTEKQSYELSGRTLLKKPEQISNIAEVGIVVVEILVDKKGKVIKAIPGQRGSTTTSSQLYAIASQKAKEAEFNPTPEGLQEQHGTYTFVFRLE